MVNKLKLKVSNNHGQHNSYIFVVEGLWFVDSGGRRLAGHFLSLWLARNPIIPSLGEVKGGGEEVSKIWWLIWDKYRERSAWSARRGKVPASFEEIESVYVGPSFGGSDWWRRLMCNSHVPVSIYVGIRNYSHYSGDLNVWISFSY